MPNQEKDYNDENLLEPRPLQFDLLTSQQIYIILNVPANAAQFHHV